MDEKHLTERLAALGHVTRFRAVKELLAAPEGLPAGRLADRLSIRQNSLSSHLSILARNALIAGTRNGREVIYCARTESLGRLLLDLQGSLLLSAAAAVKAET
jgi:ArsR family transcriptional regulator, arsenate/arsenite/antimonite-responsive transcriptional repressor